MSALQQPKTWKEQEIVLLKCPLTFKNLYIKSDLLEKFRAVVMEKDYLERPVLSVLITIWPLLAKENSQSDTTKDSLFLGNEKSTSTQNYRLIFDRKGKQMDLRKSEFENRRRSK